MIERSDFWRISDRVLDAFVQNPPPDPQNFALRASSGTSTGMQHVVVSLTEQRDTHIMLSKWYSGTARAIMFYGTSTVRLANCISQLKVDEPGKRILPIDAEHINPALRPLLTDFKPDRVIGYPSFIAKSIPFFDKETALGVTSIRSVGEALGSDLMNMFAKAFPNADYSTIYHMADVGPISLDHCGQAPLTHFHPCPGVTVEIDEPDETGIGDVLISTTLYGDVHVDQYRCGDIGRIRSEPCPCGAKETFEILGRKGNDYIKIAGGLLVRTEVDRVIALLSPVTDFRIEASLDEAARGKLTIRFYCKDALPTDALRNEMEKIFVDELFLTHDKTFRQLIAMKAFIPPRFEWVSEPFVSTTKPVKMKRV
jgi:phenylacetate-coenzyme A ligase PaaK-like adenylate-forming protein